VNAKRPLHSVSTIGVVTDSAGRVLLAQRRDNGAWEPPGGVLELGERITEGLVREVREETGFGVEPVALTGVYKSMTHAVIELVFLCRVVEGALTASDESAGFVWADREVLAALVTEAFHVRILDALGSDGSDGTAAIREHDGIRML
jgi:8-oxo-dGTP diphosphatase